MNLIDDIIELSKIEAQQIKVNSEYFILNDLLNELAIQSKIKIQECNKHIQFILNKNLPSHFNHLFSDKLRVKQILNNLLNNAIKFTQDGEITLSCYVDDKDEFVFSVSDTGIGISERNQQFIFNRFRQVHDYIKLNTGGIGLGLSICLGVSKLLGGKLNVQSELGKGSTFFFSLPSSKVGYSNTYSRSSVSKLKKKLLLIEDDSYNRGLIVEILNKYELVLANNGLDALMHFNSIPDIDLVLMDIGLPDMSGLDVTKQIRLKNKKVPIIALTAYTSIKDKQNCLAAGCNDYISKPFDTILLAEKIESLLNDCYEQFVLES